MGSEVMGSLTVFVMLPLNVLSSLLQCMANCRVSVKDSPQRKLYTIIIN